MQLGRRYLDTHLDWGKGVLRKPMAGEREETGPGLENSQSFKGPWSPTQFFPKGHSSCLFTCSFPNLIHSDAQCCSVPGPARHLGYHSPAWGRSWLGRVDGG